jgi:aspartyl protease family protein
MKTLPRLLAALLTAAALPLAAPAASPTTAVEYISPDTGSDGGMTVTRAKDGLFYVDVLVNGQPVRFLVDTGANTVVLRGEDAARLGIQAMASVWGPQMSTANGKAPMAWAKLDQVRVAGREVRDLKVAVVQNGLPVSLLGQNMLSQLASVTFSGDRLLLR